MPYVEITRDQTIAIREPLEPGVVEARRKADAEAAAEARKQRRINPRARVRHMGATADEIYGKPIRLSRGVTEVSEGVARVIREGKAKGLYGHVRVYEVAPDHTTSPTIQAPHVLTAGALKHGTEEWARMEADREAAEADARARGEEIPAPAEEAQPVHKCLECLGTEHGDTTFPSAAALERHIEVNHRAGEPSDEAKAAAALMAPSDEATVSEPADEAEPALGLAPGAVEEF